jgi:glycosyltransferase involved in cell wall biosynthesis
MRIGIDALSALPARNDGVVTYLRNLLKGIARLDEKNEYILFVSKENKGIFMPQGGNFKEVICPIKALSRLLRIFWEQFILPFQIHNQRIDLLFSPGYTAPILCQIPLVLIVYDTYHFSFARSLPKFELFIWRFLNRLSIKRARKIITVSHSSEKDILNIFGLKKSKVSVIYAAADESFCPGYVQEDISGIKKKYGIKDDFILSVATMRPNKNIRRLLEAFNILKTRYHIPHQLVLVGTINPGLKISGRQDIVLAGHVPAADLPLLYSAASLFVLPSIFEGFGLPAVEAMSCGTPVAASAVTSLPEIIQDAGLFFDPFNTEDMAKTIYRLLSDEELRKRLSAKGLERARQFSWRQAASETLAVFEGLLR